jgi:hypothetical protein
MTPVRRIAIGFVLFALAVPRVSAAVPRLIVGHGTPESCDQAAFQLALSNASLIGGGTIRFNCGGVFVAIALTPTGTLESGTPVALTVPNNTTIDGGGLIALQTAGTSEVVLFIDVGSTVALRNLTIYGSLNESVVNLGGLLVNNAVFSNTRAGAILNEGTLTVRNTSFSSNFYTSQIWNDGHATIIQSQFVGNVAGAIYNGGWVDIRDSSFDSNGGSNTGERGGSITNDFAGTLTIDNCTFAHALVEEGGAILSAGRLAVLNSTFTDNAAVNPGGGAISILAGTAVIRNSGFFNNLAVFGGAISNSGVLSIECTRISNNRATEGGGIYNAGTLYVRNSLITANTATDDYQRGGGGGVFQTDGASLRIARTSVAANTPNDIWPIQ